MAEMKTHSEMFPHEEGSLLLGWLRRRYSHDHLLRTGHSCSLRALTTLCERTVACTLLSSLERIKWRKPDHLTGKATWGRPQELDYRGSMRTVRPPGSGRSIWCSRKHRTCMKSATLFIARPRFVCCMMCHVVHTC